jgi:hypothetical protein
MRQACSTYGGEGTLIYGFGGGNMRERDQLEDLGVDRRKILK